MKTAALALAWAPPWEEAGQGSKSNRGPPPFTTISGITIGCSLCKFAAWIRACLAHGGQSHRQQTDLGRLRTFEKGGVSARASCAGGRGASDSWMAVAMQIATWMTATERRRLSEEARHWASAALQEDSDFQVRLAMPTCGAKGLSQAGGMTARRRRC